MIQESKGIQIIQEHPRYGFVPAYPVFYDYNAANFNLFPKEMEKSLERRCVVRVKISQSGDSLKVRFTRNNMLRTWLKGEIDVEDIDEAAFKLMAEVIESEILPQIGKTLEDDIVVLVDVS